MNPSSSSSLTALAGARARRMVRHRALISGVASAVPVPGLGFVIDVSMITQLISDINHEFGLTPEQIDRMTPARKAIASQAIVALGTTGVGRAVTRRVVYMIVRRIGLRLTAGQAAQFVPVAGQLVSGLISWSALKYLGERHIRQCETVMESLVGDLAPTVVDPQAADLPHSLPSFS